MRKLLLGAAIAAMAVAGLVSPQSALAGRTETRTYVAAGGDYNVLDTSTEVAGGPGIGGAIFKFRAGDNGVTIDVQDIAGQPGWYWQYTDDNDDPLADSLGYGDVCGGKKRLPKVAGATGVAIFVDQTWQIVAGCSPTKQLPGTAGTIIANFD